MATNAGNEFFYLNVCCDAGAYRIMRFGPDGFPDPASPVVDDRNMPAETLSVAWPSAIRVESGKVMLFGSRYVNNRWADVALWDSDDGQKFAYRGIVLASAADEPMGIGPGQVFYDASSARPFKMIYLVRDTPVGTTLRLATSTDGNSWEREHVVMTATEPWEKTGLAPSWVLELSTGEWALFYNAYETVNVAHAAVATAATPAGPFTNKQRILAATQHRVAVLRGKRNSSQIRVAGELRIGEPYVLRADDGSAIEPVVPIKQTGNVVSLSRPLVGDYQSAELAHIAASKPDASFVREHPDGTFSGIFTGYGHFDGALSEYTFRVRSPSLCGPWAIEPAGLAFHPRTPQLLSSAENPTSIIEGNALQRG
jgi:hypothetical protein